MKLSEFEKKVLVYVLRDKRPDLVATLEDVTVVKRNYTGMGVMVELEPNSEGPYVGYGGDVIGERSDFDDCLRFQVYVSSKGISELEIFSNSGDGFPSNLDNFRLSKMT